MLKTDKWPAELHGPFTSEMPRCYNRADIGVTKLRGTEIGRVYIVTERHFDDTGI